MKLYILYICISWHSVRLCYIKKAIIILSHSFICAGGATIIAFICQISKKRKE